jgi:acyl-CoA synthetase (AMP-forming)/AMP-acid ligase II
MEAFRTPLSVLRAAAAAQPSAPAIKQAPNTTDGLRYTDVSYWQFEQDIDSTASYWMGNLSSAGVKEGSIIGVWYVIQASFYRATLVLTTDRLKGISYEDLLHIWGIFRAGYIPQLISLRMTDPSVTHELLSKAGASALIHDPCLTSALQQSKLSSFPTHSTGSNSSPRGLKLGPVPNDHSGDQLIMIYHTSGSTSGAPKLVPITSRWMDFLIQKISSVTKFIPSSKTMVKVALLVASQ